MVLPSELVSEFVKVTNDTIPKQPNTTMAGTIKVIDGVQYVQLNGSELLTPIVTTTDVIDGDQVTVEIKNHTATVTGNMSSPAARTGDVQEIGGKISEFEIVIADKVSTKQLEAQVARIDTLVSDNVTINNTLTANIANINKLIAKDVEIDGLLSAKQAEIDNLKANKIDASIVEATYATIQDLTVTNADIEILTGEIGTFYELSTEKFEAHDASIENLEANKLSAKDADLKYANIDFANIGEAAIGKIYANIGVIEGITTKDVSVTGKLVAVNIHGDVIEGNTIKADKLIVLGDDGLYYKLNVNSLGETTASSDAKYKNGLDGSVIIAESITANKIDVTDLVAFGATIGGFKITENSIYSGTKSTIGNTTRGLFLDNTGQVAFGDSNNFLKYYYDSTSQSYKLAVSADTVTFGVGKKSVETELNNIQTEVDNVEVGGRNLIPSAVMKNITGDSTESFTATMWAGVVIDSTDLLQIIEPSTEYTLYYEVELIQRTNVPTIFSRSCGVILYSPSGATKTINLYAPDFASDELGSKVWCCHTFTTPDTLPSDYRMLGYTRRWTTNGSAPYGFDTVRFTKFKMEKGNKATDWTPAPEDVDADITAAAKTATNYIEGTSTGLIVGNMTAGTLGNNVLIDTDSVDIRNGDTVYASYGANTIYLGKHNNNAVIDICDGLAQLSNMDTLSDWNRLSIHSSNEVNLSAEHEVSTNVTYNSPNTLKTFSGKTSLYCKRPWSNSDDECCNYEVYVGGWGKASVSEPPLFYGSDLEMSSDGVIKLIALKEAVDDSEMECSIKLDASTPESGRFIEMNAHHFNLIGDVRTNTISPYDGGNLTITGDTIIDETLTVSKALNANGALYANNNIYLPNGKVLYGINASGATRQMMYINASNYIRIGYGGYVNNEGETHVLGGEAIRFYVKYADTDYKPYYDGGDNVSLEWYGAGFISSSKQKVYFSIPLSKPIIGNPTINVTSIGGITVRQANAYLYGSDSDTYAKPSSYTASISAHGTFVKIIATMPNTTNVASNNDACGVHAYIKLTFAYG